MKTTRRAAVFHIEFAFSGGAERIVLNHIDCLKKNGYEVKCFTSFIDRKNVYPDIINNYPIEQLLPGLINKIFPHDAIIILTTLFFPFLLFRFRKFDIFVGENQPAPLWAYLTSLVYKKPFIVYVNWPATPVAPRKIDIKTGMYSEVNPLVRFLLKAANPLILFLDKLSFSHASFILTNGGYVQLACKKIYKGMRVVNCAAGTNIPKSVLSYSSRKKGYITVNKKKIRKPYILMVNRHFPKKCFEYGLYGLKNLLEKKININLVIPGKLTAYTRKLEELSSILGLENKLIFTGYSRQDDLEKMFNNAFVFIYSAPEEDYGIGTVEAMSYALPVVAWDNAGPSKIITHLDDGFLAKYEDESDFMKNIYNAVTLKKGEYIRLTRNARNTADRKYSWSNHYRIFYNAINAAQKGN